METEFVRRRVNMIAAHFAPITDDVSATHLLPLNCSSSLNSVIGRRDNRMNFARQGSCSQACFMRQSSSEQESCSARSVVPPKCSGFANEGSYNCCESPLFSRAGMVEPSFAKVAAIHPRVMACNSSIDLPTFARAYTSINETRQICSKRKMHSSKANETERSPRIDVAESGKSYVMTVEIPGASINDIKVEVDDKNLTVKGNRSTQSWRAAGVSCNSIFGYHKREILQGPYQVVWPLPADVSKDNVSAEFWDGLLQIIIPKL